MSGTHREGGRKGGREREGRRERKRENTGADMVVTWTRLISSRFAFAKMTPPNCERRYAFPPTCGRDRVNQVRSDQITLSFLPTLLRDHLPLRALSCASVSSCGCSVGSFLDSRLYEYITSLINRRRLAQSPSPNPSPFFLYLSLSLSLPPSRSLCALEKEKGSGPCQLKSLFWRLGCSTTVV